MNIQNIKLIYSTDSVLIYDDLKEAFERFKWFLRIKNEVEPKLNIFYSDGKHLQFFFNKKANYIEVETLNWK